MKSIAALIFCIGAVQLCNGGKILQRTLDNRILTVVDEVQHQVDSEPSEVFDPFNSLGLATNNEPIWTYPNQANWANLGYPSCAGMRQSPIHINPMTATKITDGTCIKWTNYHNQHIFMTFKNTGRTIETSCTWLNTEIPTISGGPLNGVYKFGALHWHWGSNDQVGSEHIFNNTAAPIEMHLVHYSEKFESLEEAVESGESEALAVVGVWFKINKSSNLAMTLISSAMHTAVAQGPQYSVLPLGLLQEEFDSKYYSYLGSLTTPPCAQIIKWIVLEKPVNINESDLTIFRNVMVSGRSLVNNFRDTQALNGRTVFYYPQCN